MQPDFRLLTGEHDVDLSDEYRDEGNKLFMQDRFVAALAQYNHALVFCRSDPVRSALCYGNRSAVYIKLNYFDHCLNNIKLAEKHYPREKIQKLLDRRDRCIRMMRKVPDKSMKPLDHSFTLSYEANPTIPCFIEAIKFERDKNRLITTRDLQTGNVIAILDNSWRVPVNDPYANYLISCYNCISLNNGDLIAGECSGKAQLMTQQTSFLMHKFAALFCSEKCHNAHRSRDVDHEQLHQLEKILSVRDPVMLLIWRIFLMFYDLFGSTSELRNYVESHKNDNIYFDFDWSIESDSQEYLKNMLLLIISKANDASETPGFVIHTAAKHICKSGTVPNRIEKIFLKDTPKNLMFIDELFCKIYSSCVNNIGLVMHHEDQVLAFYSHPCIDLLGKSCDPNVFLHFDVHQRIVWTVNQPIPAGGELKGFSRADPDLNDLSRAEPYYGRLTEFCKPEVNCVSCLKGWSKQIDRRQVKIDAETNMMHFYSQQKHEPTKLSNQLKHIDECSQFINNNFNGYNECEKTRQMIAMKKEELRMSLNSLSAPLSAYSWAMINKYPLDSVERRKLSKNYEC